MAGLDALTEFRIQRIPVGGGIVLAASSPLADGIGGLGVRLLGRQIGAAAAALMDVAVAYGLTFPVVEGFVGPSTADLLRMQLVAKGLDQFIGISQTVRGLLGQVGLPPLSAGRATAIGQAPVMAPGPRQVFRSDVARKAASTRL